jgi:hypothetical protein
LRCVLVVRNEEAVGLGSTAELHAEFADVDRFASGGLMVLMKYELVTQRSTERFQLLFPCK